MRTFVVGDIHGSYSKLMAALDNAGFTDSDILYSTGDLCDRGDECLETIRFVLSLGDRFRPVYGNHDVWLYSYLRGCLTQDARRCWEMNGGRKTISAVKSLDDAERDSIEKLLGDSRYMYNVNGVRLLHTPTFLSVWNNVDVLARTLRDEFDGAEPPLLFDKVYDDVLFDRAIVMTSPANGGLGGTHLPEHDFNSNSPFAVIGHTPVEKIKVDPVRNLVNIDTCGFATKRRYGFDGRITCLSLDTGEYFDSAGGKGHVGGIA